MSLFLLTLFPIIYAQIQVTSKRDVSVANTCTANNLLLPDTSTLILQSGSADIVNAAQASAKRIKAETLLVDTIQGINGVVRLSANVRISGTISYEYPE